MLKSKGKVIVTTALLVGSTLAGAQETGNVPTFDFPIAGVVATVGATIVAMATAGAGLRGLGIAIRAGFKWASALLKG